MSIKYANPDYNGDFKTKYEFKDSVMRRAEIVFEWKNEEYEICSLDGKKWLFCNQKDDSADVYYDNLEDILNHKIGVDKLIDICTKFTVIERSL